MAGSEVEGFRGGDEFDGIQQFRQVGQRLAHAHEDQIVHALAGQAFGGEDLAGDLRGG
jgi:hypothetical protein